MAIRERKGRLSPYQVYWNIPFTGKRECANFRTREEAEKEDSLIKHRLKFERESFRKEEKKTEKEGITLEEAYFMYLNEKQFSKKSLTWQLDSMRTALRMYGSSPLRSIDKNMLNNVMSEIGKRNVKPSTIRNRMAVLKAVLRWCLDKELCEAVPFPRLSMVVCGKFIPPTLEEIESLLHAAQPHIQRVILIGAQCGARVGPCELFGLKWKNVDLARKVITISGSRKNKAAPWREVPIREALVELLSEWKKENTAHNMEYVIPYMGKPVKSIKTAWIKTLERAGIARRIRPYDLRHAFATELIAAGADIGTVAKLMGHSSPVMILNHYQYVLTRQKKEAIEMLPKIGHVPRPMCPNKKGVTETQ